jgi:hypothetical protein
MVDILPAKIAVANETGQEEEGGFFDFDPDFDFEEICPALD